MTPRLAPILAATIALIAAAACAAPIAVAPSSPAVAGRASTPPVSTAPAPTPVPTPVAPTATPRATPPPSGPTTPPDEGNVDGDAYPQLAVEAPDTATLRVTLQDPAAKAWQLVIRGTGDLAFDRLEIEVVTSDVAPVITAREIHDSELVDDDGPVRAMPTARPPRVVATRRSSVCIDSDGFKLPRNGNGRFRIQLSVADASGPLTITGSTAGWPAEPFILGSWTDTDAFAWSPS